MSEVMFAIAWFTLTAAAVWLARDNMRMSETIKELLLTIKKLEQPDDKLEAYKNSEGLYTKRRD